MASSTFSSKLNTYFKEDYSLFQQVVYFLGVMGFIGHLLFYFVLQEVFGMWEWFPARAMAALLYLSLLLLPRTGQLQRWQVLYVEGMLALTLPLLFNVYAFQNEFSTYWSTGILWAAILYGLLANPARSMLLYPICVVGAVLVVKYIVGRTVLPEELSKYMQLNFMSYFLMFLISVFQSIINNAYHIIEAERHRSDNLLENILPKPIVSRLKADKAVIADHFPSASIIFIDIQNFTSYSSTVGAEKEVWMLNDVFSRLDAVLMKHGLEKIKTIGDCYMAAAGLPEPNADHALNAASFAKEAMQALRNYRTADGEPMHFRCGIDCGPVVAGVIGEFKFIYDVWGDAVNTAARMESHGTTDRIQVTDRFRSEVLARMAANDQRRNMDLKFEERGEIHVKGKGTVMTYFLHC